MPSSVRHTPFAATLLLFSLFLTLSFSSALRAATPYSATPKYEVRAVWLTTIKNLDWPRSRNAAEQKRELCSILDRLQRAHINTVLLQVRVRATTIYPSAYEPFDVCMTGQPGKRPDYDPLQFAVDECHRRGMEIHAWMVSIPIGKWNDLGCRELRKKHPDMVKRIGDEGYLDPAHSQTAPYIARMAEEIVTRYDIDGINLDYIRYPETGSIGGGTPAQKRANITRIVREVHSAVKRNKRWVKVSCSPVGKYSDLTRYSSRGWNAYNAVFQDAQGWLKEGIMDQLYPMMYFKGNQFFPFALDWNEHRFGRMVVPGLGIYFLHPSEGKWTLPDITRQLHFLRREGMGYAFFRSKFFTDDTKGLYRWVCSQYALHPALIPPMTWEHATPPQAPTALTVMPLSERRRLAGNGILLQWRDDNPYTLYNIYASRQQPVDISDARNLIACRVSKQYLYIPSSGSEPSSLHYAVTAVDRYGNESRPVGADASKHLTTHAMPLLVCDGRRLNLSSLPRNDDARYVEIGDMSGRVLLRYALNSHTESVNVAQLEEGFYQLRMRNGKGKTHTAGYVMIKRNEE